MNYEEIKLCSFRTRTEVTHVIAMTGKKEATTAEFMECLKYNCPAWYQKDEEIPCTGMYQTVEHCKKLEK